VWFGGKDEVLEIGRVPYQLKMRYRDMFIAGSGRIPPIGMLVAQFAAEHIKV
jgi:sulfide:quinone oxidoreductase